MNSPDRYRGCLLGLACADAVGTTVEFQPPGTFPPVTDMRGGGPFGLEPGEFTDDTSMALCLGESLLECGGFDPADQMRRYCKWWREGYLSSNGRCFDIGNTVRVALQSFLATGEPYSGSTHPMSAGNGSIMRLAPVPMFYAKDGGAAVRYSGESSKTTHGCDEAVDACRLLGHMLVAALEGATREEILAAAEELAATEALAPDIAAIARGHYLDKSHREIAGTGYVVRSLEAALWCFFHSESYEQAVLRAVNLGDDADTTASVCGQIAGAHHGASTIAPGWLAKLVMKDQIQAMADALREAGPL